MTVDYDLFTELWNEGYLGEIIAEKLGILLGHVYVLRKKLGLESRGKWGHKTSRFNRDATAKIRCPFYRRGYNLCFFTEEICDFRDDFVSTILFSGKCEYLTFLISRCEDRDWIAIFNVYTKILTPYIERKFQHLISEVMGISWSRIRFHMGVSLQNECRLDDACPFKPLLPEYDVVDEG